MTILWIIRLAMVAALLGAATYAVHLYNESVRKPLEDEITALGEEKKTWQATHDADLATNMKCQKSVAVIETRLAEANAEAEKLAKDADDNKAASREAIAREKANGAVAKQEAVKWRAIAQTPKPPAPNDDAEIDAMLDQYQSEALAREAKVKEVLGLR